MAAEAAAAKDWTEEFNATAEEVKTWTPPTAPSNDQKLAMYSLFKQATVGDVNTERPGMFDLSGKAKWDAWKGREGMSKQDAMKEYVEEFKRQKAELEA
mmetsp:Transcript_28572/g.79787  ORF Transcript_28572/g.79787 Transcript_28572/m.79787 type:complete len:99 (+) Transcript_28572:37-333(+)